MSKKSPTKISPARQIAYTMMLVWFIGLAFSVPLSLQQNYPMALAACGGSFAISIVVFVIVGFLVAGDAPDNPEK